MSLPSSPKQKCTLVVIAAALALVAALAALPLCWPASPTPNQGSENAITPSINTADAAKAKSKGLSADKTYSYDLDNNKKKEKLLISRLNYSAEDGAYGKLGIYVNGKLCWSKSTSSDFFTSVTARVITLKNKKSYLWVKATGQDGVCFVNSLFYYKSKKIKTAYDLRMPSSYDYGVDRGTTYVGVSKYTIKMKHSFISATTGVTTFTYSYKYSKGKLKRTSTETKIYYNAYSDGTRYTGSTPWLRCESSLTAYTTPGGKKKAYTISAQAPFKATKVKVSGKKMYYQVTNGKKYAWISGLTRYTVYNARYR